MEVDSADKEAMVVKGVMVADLVIKDLADKGVMVVDMVIKDLVASVAKEIKVVVFAHHIGRVF